VTQPSLEAYASPLCISRKELQNAADTTKPPGSRCRLMALALLE